MVTYAALTSHPERAGVAAGWDVKRLAGKTVCHAFGKDYLQGIIPRMGAGGVPFDGIWRYLGLEFAVVFAEINAIPVIWQPISTLIVRNRIFIPCLEATIWENIAGM